MLRPALRAGIAVAFLTLAAPVHAEEAMVKLWRLDCGTIAVNDLSVFSDSFGYAGKHKTLTDSCYLIRHGATYMIWDAGLPASLLGKTPGPEAMSPTLARTLPDQLAEIGVKPEDVSLLGVSHYHFDHLGQAATFIRATLLIGEADLEALKRKPAPFGGEPALIAPWLSGERPVKTVSGDHDVFGDGSVTMLAMPGHTPGSHGLLVRLKQQGAVMLSGDVVHFAENLTSDTVPPFNTDRSQSLASMDRLRKVAATLSATLVIQHDPADIARLPAFPAAAE